MARPDLGHLGESPVPSRSNSLLGEKEPRRRRPCGRRLAGGPLGRQRGECEGRGVVATAVLSPPGSLLGSNYQIVEEIHPLPAVVSMVMKYGDNIVKVYSTSVAFFLRSTVVSVPVYLHSVGKPASRSYRNEVHLTFPRIQELAMATSILHMTERCYILVSKPTCQVRTTGRPDSNTCPRAQDHTQHVSFSAFPVHRRPRDNDGEQ